MMEVKEFERFDLDERNVILENLGKGQGRIIIVDFYYGNYSYYWGGMGSDSIQDFIISIEDSYFVDKLLGHKDYRVYDHKKTMKRIREAISEIIPWYHHMEFQKDMRYELRNFGPCDSDRDFVDGFWRLIKDLPYYLADGRWGEGERFLRDEFEGYFSEPWNYIETGPSPERIKLIKFHKSLVNYLKQKKENENNQL